VRASRPPTTCSGSFGQRSVADKDQLFCLEFACVRRELGIVTAATAAMLSQEEGCSVGGGGIDWIGTVRYS